MSFLYMDMPCLKQLVWLCLRLGFFGALKSKCFISNVWELWLFLLWWMGYLEC